MSIFGRERCEPMPARFHELADYNGRRHQGIQHTPEYAERMARLQADFSKWREGASLRELRPGCVLVMESGTYTRPRDGYDCAVRHADGDPLNNDPANLEIVHLPPKEADR